MIIIKKNILTLNDENNEKLCNYVQFDPEYYQLLTWYKRLNIRTQYCIIKSTNFQNLRFRTEHLNSPISVVIYT